MLTCNMISSCLLALHGSISHHYTLGTDYSIIFTPPFVSKDFNKLNTPSFEGALHIEIVVSLFCLTLRHLFFFDFFFTFCIDIDVVIFEILNFFSFYSAL